MTKALPSHFSFYYNSIFASESAQSTTGARCIFLNLIFNVCPSLLKMKTLKILKNTASAGSALRWLWSKNRVINSSEVLLEVDKQCIQYFRGAGYGLKSLLAGLSHSSQLSSFSSVWFFHYFFLFVWTYALPFRLLLFHHSVH